MTRPLRVAFFGQNGPFSAPALRGLLRAHPRDFEIVVVVQGLRRVPREGTHCWHFPIKFRPRRIVGGQNLRDVAVRAGLPTLATADVNASVVCDELRPYEVDILVCVGFHCLFGANLLSLPKLLAMNLHPSMLPKWRGPSPIFWLLREGETELGVTLHELTDAEDAGAILWQQSTPFDNGLSGGDLYRLAVEESLEALINVLNAPQELVRRTQNQPSGARARRPRDEDFSVVPSRWSCQALSNFIAGAAYFGTVRICLEDEVLEAPSVNRIDFDDSLPGDWIELDGLIGVRCQDGVVWLCPKIKG